MRRNPITVVALAGLVAVLVACSSGSPAPPPSTPSPSVVNYGPPTAPGGGSTGVSTANMSGSYTWYTNLAQAQSAARSQQKLILCVSTKPGCGLCDKFKNKIVPATGQRCAQMSVGYVYDIRTPDPVDKTLRANLKGAALMPLVGFLTPELGWVHGFWGPRNTSEFLGDIATAQRIYPVASNRRVGATAPDGARMASVINEFGEREWGVPGDVWPANDPEPIDAITGRPVPDAPSARPDALIPAANPTLLADAGGPESEALRPDGLLDPIPATGSPDAMVAAPPPTPAGAPVIASGGGLPTTSLPPPPTSLPTALPAGRAPTPSTFPSARSQPSGAPIPAPPTPAPPTPAAPTAMPRQPEWSGPAPSTTASPAATAPRAVPSSDLESWGRQALREALANIRKGHYDEAKHTLRAVKSKLPDTDLAREASRGTVAIFNYKKMRNAHDSDERSKWQERAQRDLGSSMWGVLFSA